MSQLEEIEQIKQLKYRYFRALDSKDWKLMAGCLAENATARYDGGKYSFDGRDQIVGFLSGSMDSPKVIGQHQGHHPEITVTGPTTANGIWYLQDFFINLEDNTTLRGAGFYHDDYIKVDGQWQILNTGYERTYEEVEERGSVRITSNRFMPAS